MTAPRVTNAMMRIFRTELRGESCAVCKLPKKILDPFCPTCYFALPEALRRPLYIERDSIVGMVEWCEAYTMAKAYLRQLYHSARRGKTRRRA